VSAEQAETRRASSKTIAQWAGYLEELHASIAHCFSRAEVRERAYRYLSGLLGEVRRKNSWQMAEAIGEVTQRGVQHLLNDACWDSDAVRDDIESVIRGLISDL
jgi:SRSO17 transposase